MKVLMNLTIKNLKTLTRQNLMVLLIEFSTVAVVGGLYLMFLLSIKQKQKYLTSNDYSKLSFEFICSPKTQFQNIDNNLLNCKPFSSGDVDDKKMTPSYLLLRMLNQKNLIDSDNQQELNQLIQVLSSLMMNGLPLVGLDDYVYMSDFINQKIGPKAKHNLLKNNHYQERFSNFLDIRNKELRIFPNGKYSIDFLNYLLDSSSVSKVINLII